MKNPDEETRKSLREFYGIEHRLQPQPIPSPTFNALVKIYSLLSDQENNPFAKFANLPEYSHLPVWLKLDNDEVNNTGGQSSVAQNCDGADGTFSGSKMTIDELNTPKSTELTKKIASEEGGTNEGTNEIHRVSEHLLDIQRILMDESDDLSSQQQPDKDLNLDLGNDFDTLLDVEFSGSKSLTGQGREIDEQIPGMVMREEVVNERKAMEVDGTTSAGGAGISQAEQSLGRRMSSGEDFPNQNVSICAEDSQSKERKRKALQQLSDRGGQTLAASASINTEEVSAGKFLDNSGKGNQFGCVAKGNSNIGKKVRKTSGEDVKSAKSRPSCVDGGASHCLKSGSDNPMVLSSMPKRNATRISRSSLTRKDEKSLPHSSSRLRYSREQLLQLRKMASTSEDMMKAVREIEAVVCLKGQRRTVSKLTVSPAAKLANSMNDANRSSKEQLSLTQDKEQLSLTQDKEQLSLTQDKEQLSLTQGKKQPSLTQHKEQFSRTQHKEQVSLTQHKEQLSRTQDKEQLSLTQDKEQLSLTQGKEQLSLTQDKEQLSLTQQKEQLSRTQDKERLSLTQDKESEVKGSDVLKSRKRGSSSEAKKEKKKMKKRKKRAEMNRKLGVKRLKLKPVLKPKVLQHCRHYLKGRCQEGDKCKFSHDVIPLTKSKPCCHFARQGCMKGEDCPFDHQLSKYPCNNFVDSGFCSRGDNCLFSHKVPAKQAGSNSGNNVQPSMVVGTASDLKTTEVDVPASEPRQEVGCPSFDRTLVDSSKDSAHRRSPALFRENKPGFISGKALQSDSAKHLPKDTPRRGGDAVETATQLNNKISSRALNLLEMFKGTSTPAIVKGLIFCSSDGPSVHKPGGKSAGADSIIGETGSQLSFTEKASASINAPEKPKEMLPDLWSFQSTSVQPTTKVDGPAKTAPSNTQKALQSALAFAAKYESGIKKSSMEIDKNATSASSGGTKPNESSPASAILQFLYRGSNKEKQPKSSNT